MKRFFSMSMSCMIHKNLLSQFSLVNKPSSVEEEAKISNTALYRVRDIVVYCLSTVSQLDGSSVQA